MSALRCTKHGGGPGDMIGYEMLCTTDCEGYKAEQRPSFTVLELLQTYCKAANIPGEVTEHKHPNPESATVELRLDGRHLMMVTGLEQLACASKEQMIDLISQRLSDYEVRHAATPAICPSTCSHYKSNDGQVAKCALLLGHTGAHSDHLLGYSGFKWSAAGHWWESLPAQLSAFPSAQMDAQQLQQPAADWYKGVDILPVLPNSPITLPPNKTLDGLSKYFQERAAKAPPANPRTCDCGAAKCRTTHAAWCSVNSK